MGGRARGLASLALILAGCGGALGGTPSPAPSHASAIPSTALAAPSAEPSVGTSASVAPAASYTPDDEQIAVLIETGTAEAIPQLKKLNKSDPSALVELFDPLGAWIASQEAQVAALAPSGCTESAVALYVDGIDAFDSIRQQFLAWKDWGAHGNAFPPGAPNQAVAMLEDAVDALGAACDA